MDKTAVISSHGLGDCLLGFQYAKALLDKEFKGEQISTSSNSIDNICLVRDEIFEILWFLFEDRFNLIQPLTKDRWAHDYALLKESYIINDLKKEYSKIYFGVPDLLHRAADLSFNFWEANISLDSLRQIRLLKHKWNPKNQIYLALNSVTQGYSHPNDMEIAIEMAIQNPKYRVYFPVIEKWADQNVPHSPIPKSLPENLFIDLNPSFLDAVKWQMQSCYTVAYDCGSFHLAHHLGQPYTLLDPRFSLNSMNVMFWARWRYNNVENSIPITSVPREIARLVKTNIEIPQTQLLPRKLVYDNTGAKIDEWGKILNFKF